MENTTLYGLFSDGGNCYSSRDDSHWFWSVTNDQTRTEFRRNLKRAGELKASRGYREYDLSSIKVKIFTSKEAFLKAANKVGIRPNPRDIDVWLLLTNAVFVCNCNDGLLMIILAIFIVAMICVFKCLSQVEGDIQRTRFYLESLNDSRQALLRIFQNDREY